MTLKKVSILRLWLLLNIYLVFRLLHYLNVIFESLENYLCDLICDFCLKKTTQKRNLNSICKKKFISPTVLSKKWRLFHLKCFLDYICKWKLQRNIKHLFILLYWCWQRIIQKIKQVKLKHCFQNAIPLTIRQPNVKVKKHLLWENKIDYIFFWQKIPQLTFLVLDDYNCTNCP